MGSFDPRSALVVVDVQNDFADPKGSLAVAGGETILPLVNRAVTAAEDAGAPVIYTQDWHPPVTPHFAKDGGIWPVHCVAGTWGAELHPALRVVGPVVRKGANGEDGYSGFTVRNPRSGEERATGLEGMLRERGTERVVVCGLATDYCVRATVLDALRLGFAADLLLGAEAAVERAAGDGDRARAEMAAAGARLIPATR